MRKKILISTVIASIVTVAPALVVVLAQTGANFNSTAAGFNVSSGVDTSILDTRIAPRVGQVLDLACMKTAVEKRETTIQASWDKFTTAIKAALSTRATELSAVWTITARDQRRIANDAAWAKYSAARLGARHTLDQERVNAWQTFRVERAACGSGPTGENPSNDITL